MKAVLGGETRYNVYDASSQLVVVDDLAAAKLTAYVYVGGRLLARVSNGGSTED